MPGLPLNTTKNWGRPGRSGDVIGRGLGRGKVSPPSRPRANCARWLWTMKRKTKSQQNRLSTEENRFVLVRRLIEPYSVDHRIIESSNLHVCTEAYNLLTVTNKKTASVAVTDRWRFIMKAGPAWLHGVLK